MEPSMGRYCLISLASGEASARQLGPERVELQERTQVLNPPGGVLGDVSVAMAEAYDKVWHALYSGN
jgi:hypothetical protein